MNPVAISRTAATILISTLAVGCAGTAGNMHPDTTPTWMKHYITGSRISRPTDSRGEAASASYVVTTSAAELDKIPGVIISTKRR